MSLSEFLQCESIMNCTREGNPEALFNKLMERGKTWYNSHPEEKHIVKENFESFGLPVQAETIDQFQHHLLLHYYEKLLGICLPPQQFSEFLRSHIDITDGIQKINTSLHNGRAVLLASSHFGAVELVTPMLAYNKLPISAVLKFKTETLAEMALQRSHQLQAEADFGKISLIQIGRKGTSAAMEMAAVLRRKEILLSIFDEKTDYSKKVSLFGKTVWGGAGIDRIIRFSGADLDVYTLFMIRNGTNRYQLQLDYIDQSTTENILDSMYSSLERVVTKFPEQWYFLHEDIPFVT